MRYRCERQVTTTPSPTVPRPFSFLGGPLYRFGRRVGLVRGETNTVPLGLALGGGLWIVAPRSSTHSGAP